MAQIIQCPGGHYYDASIFSECPHCQKGLEQGRENSSAGNHDEVAKLAREYLQKKITRFSPESFFPGETQENYTNAEADNEETVAPLKAGRRRQQESEQFLREKAGAEAVRRQETNSPANEATVAFRAPKQSSYFVTGWIVCVDGPDKGHVFNLYQGYHSIGYGRKNQICLLEDLDIAKGVHCYLVYDERKNRFYLMPEGANQTFLNGELLDTPREIMSGDAFKIGNTTFEFIAFCHDDRKWDKKDILKRGQ